MTRDDKKMPQTIDPLNNRSTLSGGKMFLPAVIGLGAIVMGVVLALYVIGPILATRGTASEDNNRESALVLPLSENIIYTVENIVINPAKTGGTRFLSVSFGFELGSDELLRNFKNREAVIRDALITILSSKTVEQLTDAREKEIARYQIKKRISNLLSTDQLAGVYYTDFVLQ